MILSTLLFLLAVVAYSIKELQSFGKLKWMGYDSSFWGASSSVRKYKYINGKIQSAPNNWYYRLTKLKYKERFPLSGSILVFLTDGAHLMQFFFKLLFCAVFYPLTNWWFCVILWVVWGLVFTLCDKYLTK